MTSAVPIKLSILHLDAPYQNCSLNTVKKPCIRRFYYLQKKKSKKMFFNLNL